MQREDVCFVMVQARHLIEYRTTAFYATWIVHTALNRSEVCFEALRDVTKLIAANMNPTSANLNVQISQVIGLPRLRGEMIALFKAHGLPTVLFDYYENWKAFSMFLIWHIEGQPVGFPAKPSGTALAILKEMEAHAFRVESLAVHEVEGKYQLLLGVGGQKQITISREDIVKEVADD